MITEQMGVLSEVDMAAFAGYCQCCARWKENEGERNLTG